MTANERCPRWAWCGQCNDWIGPKPPMLGTYWPAEKSAWMHRQGTGHRVRMMTLREVLA